MELLYQKKILRGKKIATCYLVQSCKFGTIAKIQPNFFTMLEKNFDGLTFIPDISFLAKPNALLLCQPRFYPISYYCVNQDSVRLVTYCMTTIWLCILKESLDSCISERIQTALCNSHIKHKIKKLLKKISK